ncbi:hypothetical protein KAW50_00355 [candidate division WOR-3 bacterium]|nr:hypothetical protein [candidate division WOR-3 bacterium]
MKRERAFLSVALVCFLFLLSCSRDYPILKEMNVRFPLSSGNWWVLSREWKIVFNPPSQESRFSRDSIHWEIVDKDIFHSYSSYVLKNELYEERGRYFYSLDWYTDNWNGNDGLYNIGYWNAGGGLAPAKSKYKLLFRGKEFNSPEEIFEWVQGFKSCKGDTHVRIPPRKVLEYPLAIGKEWVSFDDAWLQTRKVVDKETVTTPAGSFSCYKIEIIGEVWKDGGIWYDWFSNEGLVKRYFWFKGIWVDENGEVRGTWESTDIYLLEDFSVIGE